MERAEMTACQIAEAVNSGKVTACQLIESVIARCNNLNNRLNLFVNIGGQEALDQALEVDKKVKSGVKLPLAGVSVAVKDDFCYTGLPTSFGSPAFKNFRSPINAAVVEKLIAAGAVIIGKTNLDDLGIGSTTATSPCGPTLNPWATDRVAGSAGAAAVSAGICQVALESDSGGALRQGASHCGVFGLRPTTGRVSRYGLNMFSSSFGQAGVAARSADDLRTVLKVISGFDERDAATAASAGKIADQGESSQNGSTVIACLPAAVEILDKEQRDSFEQARNRIAARGFQTVDIKIGLLDEALRAYYVLATAESSSNYSRFDGIRFGEAADEDNLEDLYSTTRSLTFGPEARRRSIFGTFLLSEGNFEVYYRQALRVWRMVRQEFMKALGQCDYLLMPVVRALPHLVAEKNDFCSLYEEDIFCVPASMSGLPSLCYPAGRTGQLPFGLQLIGKPFCEEALIDTAGRIDPDLAFPPVAIIEER